ncbi:MAG: hypothetical protein HYV29_16005 [Ignavibacteriales bacterium]|nr:hypothetical protein [Ignavibacteriales bacterium]
MKNLIILILGFSLMAMAQQKESTPSDGKLRQYYSGKFGYYQPDKGLNNGLMLGVDGVTEFVKYDFGLTGAIDFYQKQTFNPFASPEPNISQQALILIPLHANIGYRLFNVEDADMRMFLGAGGGYYFYFYAVEYTESSGGGIIGVPSLTNKSASENGGDLFGTAFLRVLIGKIFLEPRFYFASKTEKNIGSYKLTINPSGFAITIGFQYE